MDSTHAIQIEDVTKDYGHVRAVSHLDLSVLSGEIFGFLGPNGAGKTTTIRLLTGFLKPTSGVVRVFGMNAWSDTVAVKRRLGFLPDVSALYEGMTGEGLLEYLGRLQAGRSQGRRRELCDLLELSQADLRRKIKGYSHGMRRKLAIVQAMQHDPDLVIMDEPTQGLDPLIQQAFFALLRAFRDRGSTIFFSSHVLSEVEQLCQRVAIIREGALVAVEQVRELQRLKVRPMEVEFRGPAPDGFRVPGVEVLARDGPRWRLAIRGDVNPVLRALSRYELEDLVFEQAHLEDVFLEYYRGEEDET